MSHRDYIRRGGSSAWPPEFVPGAQDFQRWDASQASFLNGDEGGTWSPNTPIIIGGQSTSNVNLSTIGSQFSGGAKTSLGGRLHISGGTLPNITPARTRTVIWHLWEFPAVSKPTTLTDDDVTLFRDSKRFGVSPFVSQEIAIPPKYIHAGARLQSVSLNFRILQRPTAAQMASANMLFVVDGAGADGQSAPTPGFINNNTFPFSWVASTVYALGAYVAPISAQSNGLYYKATSVSGTHTSAGSQPTWPTVVGATVIDNPGPNQIVWTCIGTTGIGTHAQFTDPSTFYANGNPQSLTFQTDPAATSIWDPTANIYGITLKVQPFGLLHSVQFVWSNISTLGFE